MSVEFHCEGAPRDLGLDQGRACRALLRARFSEAPIWERWSCRLGIGREAETRLTRDVRRHFPQQSEALEGLVRGSDVPRGWFTARLAREVEARTPSSAVSGAAYAATSARTGAGALVARGFAHEPMLRHSRPEGGYASVECALPWLTAALAGVNEGGLAATWVARPATRASGGCAAPAALLTQDCLARFDTVAGAADWCLGRPAGGGAVILLADAAGEVAAVSIDGKDRSRVAAESGFVFAGISAASSAALHRTRPLDASQATGALGGRAVLLDPVGRRLRLGDGAGCVGEWVGVASAP